MPKNPIPAKYAKAIESINAARDKKYAALAKRILREVVVPACKKHGLGFHAANGCFDFIAKKHGNERFNREHDARRLRLSPIVAVIELLDARIDGGNTSIGECLPDVDI